MKTVVVAGAMLAVLSSTSTVALSAGAPSASAESDRYVVIQAKLDNVMQPKSVTEGVQDCLKDSKCKAAVDEAFAQFGVPSSPVTSALASIPRAERKGEEGFFDFHLPAGYSYCKSNIAVVSVVPIDGRRASLLSASSNPRGVSAYTWTPRRNPGQGRSWVEANFTIMGVKDALAEKEYAAGTCKRPGSTVINCRGNGGGDRPACGVATDK